MRSNSLIQYQSCQRKNVKGFTLIEIIIGIVMLSISLAVVSTLIVPTEKQSADNVLQIKAAELAQSLLNDISSRAFDNNSDMAGGRWRCGEDGQDDCTENNRLGPDDGLGGRDDDDETSRDRFDDVDDFDGYNEITDALGGDLSDDYGRFILDVSVAYAGDDLDLGVGNEQQAKRITVTVTTSLGTAIEFSTHKANF